MIRIKQGAWQIASSPSARPSRARITAAWILRAASRALDSLARQIAVAPAAVMTRDPKVEFHAESGAPEGALYVDGKLIGWLEGVQRL